MEIPPGGKRGSIKVLVALLVFVRDASVPVVAVFVPVLVLSVVEPVGDEVIDGVDDPVCGAVFVEEDESRLPINCPIMSPPE